MPEFLLVEAPVHAPGRCLTCGASNGPMIDTLIRHDSWDIGALYLCPACVVEAGRLIGSLSPEQATDAAARLASASERISELVAELAAERENKLVSLADVLTYVASEQKPVMKTKAS